MQSSEECLLMYRRTLRQALGRAGVASNPAVTDEWVLERILERMGVQVEVIIPESVPKEENPLDVLKEHFTAVRDYGYANTTPPDVLRAIELAREGKLKGVKVGL